MNSSEAQNFPLFCVREITHDIRVFLETRFSYIGIRGEISSFNKHSSGHWYFSLKDEDAQIQAVMFKGSNQKVSFIPKIGEEVIVWGKVTVYEPRGTYQILTRQMEKVGDGVLQKAFEKLKVQLNQEGLFEKKRSLPYLPKKIAIITSPTGAALKDVLNVLSRRASHIEVILVPALMEGKQAVDSLIQAFKQTYKLNDIDLILVTRGGGSAESLFVFNHEKLARIAFESPVPLVSAIGHEIDFTIMDFIADLRAPTPSVAGELVSQNASELLEKISQYKKHLILNFENYFKQIQKDLAQFQKILVSPLSKIEDLILKCDDLSLRLKQQIQQTTEFHLQKIKSLTQSLTQLNPTEVMSRGYSLCFMNGKLIRNEKEVKVKDNIDIQFFKGKAQAQIFSKESK